MSPARYRIVLQLDRARDDDAGFEDPIEVFTDEEVFAIGVDGRDADDERGRAIMREIAAAMEAILCRHGATRPDADAKRGA